MSLTPDHLAAYLSRIGLLALPKPDAQGLALLQTAHRSTIAFENLDIRLGRPILIDNASVFDKLVTRQRGGYCFEQNRLFADMLALIGLPSRPLLARVHLGAQQGVVTPRTHVLLLLDIDGEPWIADAGFGAANVPPLPLREGMTIKTGDGANYRLRKVVQPGDVSDGWLIERRSANHAEADHWQPQYTFGLSTVEPIDLEQCNHWTATRPGTRFMTLNVVSIVLPDGFASMTDGALSITRNRCTEQSTLIQPSDYHAILTTLFGLSISTGDVAALPLFARA